MKNLVFLSILFMIFISCEKKEIKYSNIITSFDNFYEVNYNDTVYIKSHFSECGEWGGHKEIIKLYYIEQRKTILEFQRFDIDCDKRDSTGILEEKPILNKKFALTNNQKVALESYFISLMKSKFIEGSFGNSGNTFSIEDSRGKLKISKYGKSNYNIEIYNSLLKSLNISEIKID